MVGGAGKTGVNVEHMYAIIHVHNTPKYYHCTVVKKLEGWEGG